MNQAYDWPYVLKPQWVHDLLLLWRQKQSYDPYIEQVTDYSVREVRDQSLRRCCVMWMAAHFAPNQAASTMSQNVWASYSQCFRTNDLAPAYLAYLTLCEPLAQQLSAALCGQLSPGVSIQRSQLCDVTAVPGALESLLRTLVQSGVLAADPRRGGYVADGRLRVAPSIFPLLVWSWWLETRQPSVALDAFDAMPVWAWVETQDFAAGWQHHAGRLWTLEKDAGVPTVHLHPADSASFERALLNLLSTDGQRKRRLPRQTDPGDARVAGVQQSAHAPLALGR